MSSEDEYNDELDEEEEQAGIPDSEADDDYGDEDEEGEGL